MAFTVKLKAGNPLTLVRTLFGVTGYSKRNKTVYCPKIRVQGKTAEHASFPLVQGNTNLIWFFMASAAEF